MIRTKQIKKAEKKVSTHKLKSDKKPATNNIDDSVLSKIIALEDKLPCIIADDYLKSNIVITTKDKNRFMYRYNEDTGMYEKGYVEEDIIAYAKVVSKHRFTNHLGDEVIANVRSQTFKHQSIFNTSPNLIGLLNGVLNLDRVNYDDCLMPHSPDNYLTESIPVKFDRNAKCPKIDKFLEQVLGPTTKEFDQVMLFYEMLGSCLYRRHIVPAIHIFFGEGKNGKSKLIELVRVFLGSCNISSVTMQDLASSTFAPSSLYHKLANVQADISSEFIKDNTVLKRLTGDDSMRIQYKFKDSFDYVSYAKLIWSCNKPPRFSSNDSNYGFWRRIVLYQLRNTFEGKNDNVDIINDICSPKELSGLLNQALNGLEVIRIKRNFDRVMDIKTTEEVYNKLSDTVSSFVEDCVEFTGINYNDLQYVLSCDMYASYCNYCESIGVNPIQQVKFSKRLRQDYKDNMKLQVQRVGDSTARCFVGCKLIDMDTC